jgi:pimeloyl-ACP methyl ester carboxylesterase
MPSRCRSPPLRDSAEVRDDDRQRARHQERCSSSLQEAGDDQELGRGRRGAQQRCGAETYQSDPQNAHPAESVRERTGQQNERPQCDEVGIYHPLQLGPAISPECDHSFPATRTNGRHCATPVAFLALTAGPGGSDPVTLVLSHPGSALGHMFLSHSNQPYAAMDSLQPLSYAPTPPTKIELRTDDQMPLPLVPTRTIEAGELSVGYVDAGDPTARPVVLLHGFPYDIHSYVNVIPLLIDAGLRVLVPYLRGHGPTRFLDERVARSGQQAALAADLSSFIDALELRDPILAGYDWGGRAACAVAALWPDKVAGLVSVNGYLIQNIAASQVPLQPELEAGFWYFWYFATERGRAGLEKNRREIAEVIWKRNSPDWAFTPDDLATTANAFENPDYVDIVIHSYRHRLGLALGTAQFDGIERRLAEQPAITVPTVTLDGMADGNFPATDGSAQARFFTGFRDHRQIPHAGHNLPAEQPRAFADAIFDLADSISRG